MVVALENSAFSREIQKELHGGKNGADFNPLDVIDVRRGGKAHTLIRPVKEPCKHTNYVKGWKRTHPHEARGWR